MENASHYINPGVNVRRMDIEVQFNRLSARQKLYAYYMSRYSVSVYFPVLGRNGTERERLNQSRVAGSANNIPAGVSRILCNLRSNNGAIPVL
jgi:hypothetical protein